MKNQRALTLFALIIAVIFSITEASAQNIPPQPKALKSTVILVSIDGYRADYITKYPTATLSMLAHEGVRAKWMIPSYPSLTFPNHYAIATGLYPEHNGITGNSIYDPDFKAIFSLGKREEVQNGRWWWGEPIWVTAEKQGQKSAAFFFPGTEAEIASKRPTFFKTFNDKVPNFERIDTVLTWLDLPEENRPTLITTYFSDVDHAGHDSGPESNEVKLAIEEVDKSLHRLVSGLILRGIYDKVNIIIVSDHGMTRQNPVDTIILDDYFDLKDADEIVWNGTLVSIYPKAEMADKIYNSLKSQNIKHASVYRKSEVPSRFNYNQGKRIGDIVVMADEGWYITSKSRHRPPQKSGTNGIAYRGAHGYDNQLESMRAFFVGHGPAFKSNKVTEPFNNVDVYNIIANILKLKPTLNDGSDKGVKAVLK